MNLEMNALLVTLKIHKFCIVRILLDVQGALDKRKHILVMFTFIRCIILSLSWLPNLLSDSFQLGMFMLVVQYVYCYHNRWTITEL